MRWRQKRTEPTPWPDVINGYQTRPRFGACPECAAVEDVWCASDCARLDPMDYR